MYIKHYKREIHLKIHIIGYTVKTITVNPSHVPLKWYVLEPI